MSMAAGKGESASSFAVGNSGNNSQGMPMNGYQNNKKAKNSDTSNKGMSKSMIAANLNEDEMPVKERKNTIINKF